jgi:hypothetical protein
LLPTGSVAVIHSAAVIHWSTNLPEVLPRTVTT